MAAPSVNPLSDEHCQCLDKVLASVGPALELAKACKDCGLNVDEYEQQLQTQQQIATNLKAKFFPHRP